MNTRRLVSSPWFPYLLTLASALPLGALIAGANQMPEHGCSGIGFGCSLYSWDLAAVALIVFGIPYAVVLGIVLALMALSPRLRTARETAGWVGLAIPWIAVLVALTAT